MSFLLGAPQRILDALPTLLSWSPPSLEQPDAVVPRSRFLPRPVVELIVRHLLVDLAYDEAARVDREWNNSDAVAVFIKKENKKRIRKSSRSPTLSGANTLNASTSVH